MRWRLACAALALLSLVGCGDDDPSTVADPEDSTTSTTVAMVTSTPGGTCPDVGPPFAPTWVPDGWSPDVQQGRGGTGLHECDAWHWGPADAMGSTVDVFIGDGAEALNPELSYSITVLGRPARLGPIHEGYMVVLDDYALKGYGIIEADLVLFAVGLFASGQPNTPEVTDDDIPDGVYAGRLQAVDAGEVAIDFLGWYVGEEANRVATEHGETDVPVPNDYYIANDDPDARTLPVDDAVVVSSHWAEIDAEGCDGCQHKVIPYARLVEIFTGPEPDAPEGNLRHDPWWITIVDGRITRLDEQYVP